MFSELGYNKSSRVTGAYVVQWGVKNMNTPENSLHNTSVFRELAPLLFTRCISPLVYTQHHRFLRVIPRISCLAESN